MPGWVGGTFGVGNCISIKSPRALLTASLSGKLDSVTYKKDSAFGFELPTQCPDVPANVLDSSSSWTDKGEYDKKYKQLAQCKPPIRVERSGPQASAVETHCSA